jgi:ABC-2 type transport system permease protein
MTQTTTHEPTFLQKLLGKNYKWWFLLVFNLKRVNASPFAWISGYLSQGLLALTIVYIWFLGGANTGTLTYLAVGKVFYSIITVNGYNYLAQQIETGKISNLLLLPSPFFRLTFFYLLGTRLLKNLALTIGVLIGVFVAILTFTRFDIPEISAVLILIFYFLPIGFILQYFLGMAVGSFNFFINDKRDYEGLISSYTAIFTILSGTVIPLDKLPNNLINIVQLLPTSWLLHHPMQVYLGKYSPLETFYVFLGGIFWCFVLYLLAKLVFKLGLKRNEAVGL